MVHLWILSKIKSTQKILIILILINNNMQFYIAICKKIYTNIDYKKNYPLRIYKMNHQTSTNLDSKMEEAIKALGIKNNNLIDMSLLTGFVTLLKNSKENKEVIKLIFELCNSQVKDDAAKDKQ